MGKSIVLFVALIVSAGSLAELTESSPAGFVSEHVLVMEGSPDAVYRALTDDVHRWWNAEHSYSLNAENFSLDARAGGCFCEQLDSGGSVEHLRVVFADPGRRLRLTGGLGPLQSMAVGGSMDFALESEADGQTTLRYRYMVGGYVPGGLERIAPAVDKVQLGQLTRLQRYLATGSPTGE